MNSVLSYIGGKSQLSKIIIPRIPAHKTYCEVFAGAAWIFFRKEPSVCEILNDKDGELISFYRVLQNHLEEFMKQFKWLLSSREWWNDYKRQLDADGLTDIQRAARYYYVQRHSFGGKVRGRTFGTSTERPPKINLLRMEEDLSEAHLRLSNVTVENLDWKTVIEKYNRDTTFFYIDPPYYKAPFYKHNLELQDYSDMASTLNGIKGKFILSINDLPEMREVFANFKIEPVRLRYTCGKNNNATGNELLVCNWE